MDLLSQEARSLGESAPSLLAGSELSLPLDAGTVLSLEPHLLLISAPSSHSPMAPSLLRGSACNCFLQDVLV